MQSWFDTIIPEHGLNLLVVFDVLLVSPFVDVDSAFQQEVRFLGLVT